jgi:hypothetical protein
MKHWWIEYRPQWTESPMSCWVHLPTDALPWYQAQQFEPPLPRPIGSKGYPIYFVTAGRFTFQFSSLAELEQCIETLSQKILPPTVFEYEGKQYYANRHWLSRLPGKVKSWRDRQKAIKVLVKARESFKEELASLSYIT